MMKFHLIGISLVTLLSLQSYADVYKWVDEKGVTHYGNQKPPTAKAEQVKVSGTGGKESSQPDPLDKMDPEARELAEAMKKELMKDHGTADLNCSGAYSNAMEQINNYLAQAKRNLDGGYINQAQFNEVNTMFGKVKSRISTSRCQSASGVEKEFYQCMSNDMNAALMCIGKAESIFN